MQAFGWVRLPLGFGLAGFLALSALGAAPIWAGGGLGSSRLRVVHVTAGSHPSLSDAPEIIIGTSKDDVITGVDDGDVVFSRAGDDTIYFASDPEEDDEVLNAFVDTGTGNDLVVLQFRNAFNTIRAGPGNDRAVTSATGRFNNHNTFDMGPGNDFVDQGPETFANTVLGGTGNDEVTGSTGEGDSGLYFDLGPGDDKADTSRNSGRIIGGPGNDEIVINLISGQNVVSAGTGNDYVQVRGDNGENTIDMGAGADRIELSGRTHFNTIRLGPGADVLTSFPSPEPEGITGTKVDGGTNYDSAEFDVPVNPPNVCVRVEQAVNC